jgi:nitrilase
MRVAAAQAHPAWLDKTATTERVVCWIERAANDGIDLLAFPETFLPGYPSWVCRTDGARFDEPQQKRAYGQYLDAAVELDGPEIARITEAVHDLGVFVYLGVAERGTGTGRGTVFCTLAAIDPGHGVIGRHRKLVPTYDERLVWGWGDGHGLRVHRVGGWRVGGLICWENWMPQARHALYADGEELHISVWPGSVRLTRDVTRFVAREGRVWHLAVGGLLTGDDVPDDFLFADQLSPLGVMHDGGSAIAAPDGTWVVEPVAGREALVAADINHALVDSERQNFDPAGHYARPDVFDVRVDRRRREAASFVE